MARQKIIYIYVIVKRKIRFPKVNFVKITYVDAKREKELSSFLKLKKKSKHHTWIISDSLRVLRLAARANCKTILLANGMELEWNFYEDYYPYLIAASAEQILNFLYLTRYIT